MSLVNRPQGEPKAQPYNSRLPSRVPLGSFWGTLFSFSLIGGSVHYWKLLGDGSGLGYGLARILAVSFGGAGAALLMACLFVGWRRSRFLSEVQNREAFSRGWKERPSGALPEGGRHLPVGGFASGRQNPNIVTDQPLLIHDRVWPRGDRVHVAACIGLFDNACLQ